MSLRYEPRARRALKKLAAADQQVIVAALKDLVERRSPTADVKKLVDVKPPTWRLRVGRWRVLYRLIAGNVVAVDIDDRRDVYR